LGGKRGYFQKLSSEAGYDQLTHVCGLEIENVFSTVFILVLVLVSNQELGTGGPEECS
jgi:hypothetical protein